MKKAFLTCKMVAMVIWEEKTFMKKNLRQNNQWNKGEQSGTRKGTAFWNRKLKKQNSSQQRIEVEKSYKVEKEKLLNMADWILSKGEGGMAMQLILFIPFVTKHFPEVNKVHCIPYGYYYELYKVK